MKLRGSTESRQAPVTIIVQMQLKSEVMLLRGSDKRGWGGGMNEA
jgi:hypothetical protein